MCSNANKYFYIRIGKRFDVPVCNVFIDSQVISWTDQIRYLGVTIVAGRTFRCDLHKAKIKYFKSLNGILGKMGSDPPISLTLTMINTFCLPSLMYGLEAIYLTKKQIDSISYPYNAAFVKLFKTFNINTIYQCQFYCGFLLMHYLIDMHTLNFYSKLKKKYLPTG